MRSPSFLAAVIAEIAHRGQTRMDGVEPYIAHPRRVAEALRASGAPAYVHAAGLLHDVLEDSIFEACDLEALGVPTATVELVDAVSKREGETYRAFIERVANHPDQWARALKAADIRDNLASLPEGHESRVKRYQKALARLAQDSGTASR